jgi:hypothetical protein
VQRGSQYRLSRVESGLDRLLVTWFWEPKIFNSGGITSRCGICPLKIEQCFECVCVAKYSSRRMGAVSWCCLRGGPHYVCGPKHSPELVTPTEAVHTIWDRVTRLLHHCVCRTILHAFACRVLHRHHCIAPGFSSCSLNLQSLCCISYHNIYFIYDP